MNHGTRSRFLRGCRCEACVTAYREQMAATGRRGRGVPRVDRELLAEALQDLFPLGLTDDCPARRARR